MRRRRRRKKFTETVIHSKCFNYSHENRTGQWYGVDLIVRQESSFSQSLDAFAVKSRSSGGALPVYRFVPKRCADCILTIAPCSGMYQQCPGTMYPAISCTNGSNYFTRISFVNIYIWKCSTLPSDFHSCSIRDVIIFTWHAKFLLHKSNLKKMGWFSNGCFSKLCTSWKDINYGMHLRLGQCRWEFY